MPPTKHCARTFTATILTRPRVRTWSAPWPHLHEAYIATNEIGKARSVQRLVGDLDKVNHIVAKVRRRERPTVNTKSIRI